MNHDLKPYPEYKDSGVPWLGELPAHWEVLPNRALFAEVKDRNHPGEQMLSVTITKGVILQQALLANSSKKDSSNEDKSAYKLVCPRDIAYNKMRAWQGAIGISDFRGIISPAYVVVRLRNNQDPRYFHHLYRTPMFAKEAERWSYGITSDMWSLRPEHFKMIYTALPPLPEQSAIVRFIDHFERRINRLIRDKRRLIELLNEHKQAIIHRAVTRGIDPNVRLKPSGVEWLGDVPEHWQITRGKFVGRLFSTPSITDAELTEQSDENAMYLKVSDLSGLDRSLSVQQSSLYVRSSQTAAGNTLRPWLVFPKRGGAIFTNKVGIVKTKCFLDPNLMGWEISDGFEPMFVAMVLKARTLSDIADISSVPQINNKHINPLPLPAPPIREQRAILAELDDSLADVNSVIEGIEREISLLREYRTRLIADVVTGKLDVRGVELPKLDETEMVEDREIGEEAEVDETGYTEEIADGEEQ